MLIKRIVTAAAAAFSLSLLANAAMADPASTEQAGVSPADQQAPVASDSPLVLVRGGHGGGGHGGGHSGISSGSRAVGHGANFSRLGVSRRHDGDRDRDRRRRRFRRDFVFIDGDYGYDGYDGGSCYANCRQSHGPRYCRIHSANFC